MTPDVLSLVVKSVDDLRSDMNRRFDDQDERLDRIEEHTSATNGRVGRLELWRARSEGLRAAFHWVPPLLAGLAGAAVAAGATAFITLVIH